MEGHRGPGGSRVVAVVLLELVRLGVDAPYEEEAGDGGGEEDEDHPQRAHAKLLPCEPPNKERKGNCEEEEENPKQLGAEPNNSGPFSFPTNPGDLTRLSQLPYFTRPEARGVVRASQRADEEEGNETITPAFYCGAQPVPTRPDQIRAMAMLEQTRFASGSPLPVTSPPASLCQNRLLFTGRYAPVFMCSRPSILKNYIKKFMKKLIKNMSG
jgi:hypothetical protein